MEEDQQRRQPICCRTPQENGSYKSLKMSIGKKKLHEDEGFARIMYQNFILNGVQYCRRHLMLKCHLCRVDTSSLREEVDEEREALGLRLGGDPKFNARAEKWQEYITEKQLEVTLQRDLLNLKYGTEYLKNHPEHWNNLTKQLKRQEREMNDKFLAENDEIFKDGASQCCYWACETPNGQQRYDSHGRSSSLLLRCAGCGIAKYCCKQHQKLDWVWEHKGECKLNVPEFLRREIEQDRLRNLNGNYTSYRDM